MVCDRNGRACANAAQRNGVAGYASRSLNAVSSWKTVNAGVKGANIRFSTKKGAMTSGMGKEALKEAGAVAGMVAVNTALDAVGLSVDREGTVHVKNAKGLMVATHAIERVTGSAVTLLNQSVGRSKPFAKYRGVVLRRAPPGAKDPTIARLTRGRIVPQREQNYNFNRDGITWSVRTTDYKLSAGGNKKTLSVLRSHAVPRRAFVFDRHLGEQDAVDLTFGSANPEQLPGYLGNISEVDSLLPGVGEAKTALMGLSWLTVDDTQRDVPGGNFVDYDKPFRPKSHYSYSSRLGSTNARRYSTVPSPTVRTTTPRGGPQAQSGMRSTAARTTSTPSGTERSVKYDDLVAEAGAPLAPESVVIDGQTYDVAIERIDDTRDGMLAEAYYNRNGHWTPVSDPATQAQLAEIVIENFKKHSAGAYK